MYSWSINCRRFDKIALAGVAQWIEHWPANQKVASSIPGQGTCLGCWPGYWLGGVRGNRLMSLSHVSVSLPLFLPPFPSLSKLNLF